MALIELGATDKEVHAITGDHLVVRLEEQGGTGYVWMVDEVPPGALTVADAVEFDDPLVPGGTQARRLEFALGSNSGRLVVVKRRPWGGGAGIDRFEVNVVVAETEPDD